MSRPDWVMVGVQGPDGCQVWASTDLTRCQLEAEAVAAGDLYGFGAPIRCTITRYELSASMGTVVLASGKDYTEALRNLFAYWSPEDGDRRELSPARPALREPKPCPTCEGSRSVGEPGFTYYGIPEPGSFEPCPDCLDEHGIPTGYAR